MNNVTQPELQLCLKTCYDQAVIKFVMLQKEDRFLNCPDVQNMRFCQKWWQRFHKDKGKRLKKICSNHQICTNNEVEIERERLREIMNSDRNYEPD